MKVVRLAKIREGSPLQTVRRLLRQIWRSANLEGLFVTTWTKGSPAPEGSLLKDPQALNQADPFAPVMRSNLAPSAIDVIRRHPEHHYGVMLRACEMRSLSNLAAAQRVNLTRTLLISMDCLAVFPTEDFDWLSAKSNDKEQLTHRALHFAAQGGILPSRYQRSCQLCTRPYPQQSDIHFQLLGVETSKHLLISLQEEHLATRLGLEGALEEVPPEVEARRRRVLEKLEAWRKHTLAYSWSHLDESQSTPEALLAHLEQCSSCRKHALGHCPVFRHAWKASLTSVTVDTIRDWLRWCAGCGMCDFECPEGYPLFAVVTHLRYQLEEGVTHPIQT